MLILYVVFLNFHYNITKQEKYIIYKKNPQDLHVAFMYVLKLFANINR